MLYFIWLLSVHLAGKKVWNKVSTTEDLEYSVSGLNEGTAYHLQVAAENEIGTGPFVELSRPAVPKSQYSKYCQSSLVFCQIYVFSH